MRFEPILGHFGLYRDTTTKEVFNIIDLKPAHVVWTFREGPMHPNVRLSMSLPNMKWPFILSSVSAPLVGNGAAYFRLKEAVAPLAGVQQFKTRALLINTEAELREAKVDFHDGEIVTVFGFGVMRQ